MSLPIPIQNKCVERKKNQKEKKTLYFVVQNQNKTKRTDKIYRFHSTILYLYNLLTFWLKSKTLKSRNIGKLRMCNVLINSNFYLWCLSASMNGFSAAHNIILAINCL